MYVSVSTTTADVEQVVQVRDIPKPGVLYRRTASHLRRAVRAPGSYPAPHSIRPPIAVRRLYDIVANKAQVFLTYADVSDITTWSRRRRRAASGDRINVELSVEPSSGRIDMMTNDRSYSGNTLFDVRTSRVRTADRHGHHARHEGSWDPSRMSSLLFVCEWHPTVHRDYDGIVSLPARRMIWTGPGKTFGQFRRTSSLLRQRQPVSHAVATRFPRQRPQAGFALSAVRVSKHLPVSRLWLPALDVPIA